MSSRIGTTEVRPYPRSVELLRVERGVGDAELGARLELGQLASALHERARERRLPPREERRRRDVVVVDDQRLVAGGDEVGDRRADRGVVEQPGRLAAAVSRERRERARETLVLVLGLVRVDVGAVAGAAQGLLHREVVPPDRVAGRERRDELMDRGHSSARVAVTTYASAPAAWTCTSTNPCSGSTAFHVSGCSG